ncbi:endolytic transglycosylase MltG [Robiginitalea sediminis]|uniref:endolytic transglycosylase MltG n=1 Tax=Robiginitalea sediminis TaxID=1982593 RepID=UPI000B4AB1BE|nr:endolytic transglycosylase MltG [Robiginitalea sediminis]
MYIKRILLILVLLGLLGGGLFAAMVYRTFFTSNTAFANETAYVYIPSDAGYPEVRAQLEPLLEDLEAFDAVATRKRYVENVRPGRYPILRDMNNNDIVNALRSRNTPVTLAFNNQERIATLAGRVAQQIEADSAALVTAMTDPEFLKSRGLSQDQAMALYLPNSYEFYWNTSATGFRDRMAAEYDRFWNEERKAAARSMGMTPEEVIALAAIVHKETAKADERPRVAGVYLNRLRLGMPLQADPTVIYAIKKETGRYDTVIKRVLYRDLEIASPYNTYRNKGLPPGPIFMPDMSAIRAVLNPEKHNYLYFVVDTQNFGYHVFAESLAQHNRNKEQYIRWINAQNIRR